MRLKVLLPTKVLIDEEVMKITAEAEDGLFCLLPRHVDFLSALVPSILSFETPAGSERFLAIDEGILLKHELEVLVSTRHAIEGNNLGELHQTIQEQFLELNDLEKTARSAAIRLESNLVHRFMELREHGH
jgi:F-type H+-transporting ATPase subunit epsilon